MGRVVWEDVIYRIDEEESCMPTGVTVDCQDNIYVTGFMASNKGFIRKYGRDGSVLWTLADFADQATE